MMLSFFFRHEMYIPPYHSPRFMAFRARIRTIATTLVSPGAGWMATAELFLLFFVSRLLHLQNLQGASWAGVFGCCFLLLFLPTNGYMGLAFKGEKGGGVLLAVENKKERVDGFLTSFFLCFFFLYSLGLFIYKHFNNITRLTV